MHRRAAMIELESQQIYVVFGLGAIRPIEELYVVLDSVVGHLGARPRSRCLVLLGNLLFCQHFLLRQSCCIARLQLLNEHLPFLLVHAAFLI